MIFIIGSGPSGVSAAKALLDRKELVTILDIGAELKLRDNDTEKSPQFAYLKSQFNSYYSYDFKNQNISKNSSGYLTSRAKGGHSAVWGATLEVFEKKDFAGWEIDINELFKGYHNVLKFLPISSANDVFYNMKAMKKIPSNFFAQLHQALNSNANQFNYREFKFKHSTLAIFQNRCKNLDSCLTGCASNVVYSASETLTELLKDPNFKYIPNLHIDTISETEHGVIINPTNKNILSMIGKKCILAAGPINNLIILKKSNILKQDKYYMRDSQYFVFPIFSFKKIQQSSALNFSQYFISYQGHSKKWFFQFYELQKSFLDYFFTSKIFQDKYNIKIANILSRHMLISQSYLDSENSTEISLNFDKNNQVVLTYDRTKQFKTILRIHINIVLIFAKLIREKVFVLPFMIKVFKPGSGFHCGGILPMKFAPKENEVDLLGRPLNCKHIHLVDSTVLNSILPGPITLTSMANAHRIGSSMVV